ncbi:MAG: DUF1905 domain-containing protein [Actinomycetota bacterium]|nr:DUF1905 domain-containing protein [Actinomycetota bacterium]
MPPEVVEALGPKKRVPVRVTVNDYTYRSTVAPPRPGPDGWCRHSSA